jgi:hypothetical protein
MERNMENKKGLIRKLGTGLAGLGLSFIAGCGLSPYAELGPRYLREESDISIPKFNVHASEKGDTYGVGANVGVNLGKNIRLEAFGDKWFADYKGSASATRGIGLTIGGNANVRGGIISPVGGDSPNYGSAGYAGIGYSSGNVNGTIDFFRTHESGSQSGIGYSIKNHTFKIGVNYRLWGGEKRMPPMEMPEEMKDVPKADFEIEPMEKSPETPKEENIEPKEEKENSIKEKRWYNINFWENSFDENEHSSSSYRVGPNK